MHGGDILTDEERKLQYSFSRLSCYETCPYSYYLKYILNEPDEQNAFALYGTHVHSILEKYFNGELELFELSDYYEDHFDDAVPLDFPPNSYCSLGQKYFDGGLKYFNEFEGLDGYEILGVELEFTVPLFENYRFHGFIDLLLRDPNGKIVIEDHKSHIFKNKAEVAKYARQLFLYSLYVKEQYGEYPDRVVFNTFRNQKHVKIEFTQEKLDEAIQWAKDTIMAIENETEWQAKPQGYFCDAICGYKNSCLKKNGGEQQ